MKKIRKKAFSLIEIIIAISIIALLSSLAIPNIKSYFYKANKTKIITATNVFNTIYIEYLFNNNVKTLEEVIEKEGIENLKNTLKLDSLNTDGSFNVSNIKGQFYIEDNIIKYRIDGEEWFLFSLFF